MEKRYKYSNWNGVQGPFPLEAQDIMGQLADLFLESSDFSWALNMMLRKGVVDDKGKKVVLGIDDLIQQIKALKGQYLERYNSGEVFAEHWQRLYQILNKELHSVRQLLDQLEGKDLKSIANKEALEKILGPISGKDLVEKLRRLKGIESILRTHLAPRWRRLTSVLNNYKNHSWTIPKLRAEFALLIADLENISAVENFLDRHKFKGQEYLDYLRALRLKEEFGRLEALDKLLQKVRKGARIGEIDGSVIKELLGEEAQEAIEQLKQLAGLLEEAGFVACTDDAKLQLTPKGIREIGQKALRDIFSTLRKGRLGKHTLNHKGAGGYLLEDRKPYQFGDPFIVDLTPTLINSLSRQARDYLHQPSLPLTLSVKDFEVYQPQYLTRCSTVLMLDMSWSMTWENRFLAAKKVAIALHNLLKTQYPRDALYIVGFYSTARELKVEDLPYLQIHAGSYGTNMQAGLKVSGRLLARDSNPNKQIIMITDGEPTAHFEKGELFFQYPPAQDTLYCTLSEVRRCTREGITITVFMLNSDDYLAEFVNKISLINRGRAFYTTPDNLGKYLLIDYITNKRKQI